MSDAQVWERFVAVIRDMFEDETLVVTRDTTAADVPDWDSLAHVELIVALESEFGMRFRTGEIAGLKNVGELADVIERRTGNAGP